MYTRCPSCRSEISFEPPANMEALPEGYKHRIKCPCCGATIGVKINKVDTSAYNNTYNPAYEQMALIPFGAGQQSFEPVGEFERVDSGARTKSKANSKAKAKSKKKPGTGRNIVMLLFSLIIIAINVVAYLFTETIEPKLPDEGFGWLSFITAFDGIGMIEGLTNEFVRELMIVPIFELSALKGFLTVVLPILFFALACIQAVVAIVSLFGKKYGRAYNFWNSFLLLGITAVILFTPCIPIEGVAQFEIGPYFEYIVEAQAYLVIAVVAFSALQVLFSLIFCDSLGKKKKKNKNRR